MGRLMKSGKSAGSASARGGEGEASHAELALRALVFLSRDDERTSRFLALTGLDAADLRSLLGDRGFHLAILDHIASDEAMLLEFAASESLPPEAVGQARRALGGGE